MSRVGIISSSYSSLTPVRDFAWVSIGPAVIDACFCAVSSSIDDTEGSRREINVTVISLTVYFPSSLSGFVVIPSGIGSVLPCSKHLRRNPTLKLVVIPA